MTAKDKGEASGAEQRLIRELAEILDDTGLSEIEFEKSGLKIRVARELSVQPIAAVPLAAPAAAAPPAAAAAAAPDPAKPKFMEGVPPSHRQGNCIPSAAI